MEGRGAAVWRPVVCLAGTGQWPSHLPQGRPSAPAGALRPPSALRMGPSCLLALHPADQRQGLLPGGVAGADSAFLPSPL